MTSTYFRFIAYYLMLYWPVAIWISFFPVWLKYNGISVQSVGLFLSIGSALTVIMNPLTGYIADRFDSRHVLLTILITLALGSASFLIFAGSHLAIFVWFFALKLFSASHIPLSESILLFHVQKSKLSFGVVRCWGSFSVILVTLALGYAVQMLGPEAIIYALALGYAAQLLFACLLPRGENSRSERNSFSLRSVVRLPGYVLLLMSAAVSQACHGIFYSYSALYWTSNEISGPAIGWLWALGVGLEILVFAFSGRYLANFSAGAIVCAACIVGAVRWSILAFDASIGSAIFVQILQGGTLGLTQLGVARYMSENVPDDMMSSATGIYAGTAGIAMAALIFVGGHLYAIAPSSAFTMAAASCAIATLPAALLTLRLREAYGKSA